MSAEHEDKNILTVLSENKDSYSRRQQNVARYISENCEKAAFMTAEMLAREANVSESTVVRFAVELGYENYPDMRRAMQQVLKRRIINIYRQGSESEDSSAGEILMLNLSSAVETLQDMQSEKNRRGFKGIIDAVERCRHIYILGDGDNAPFCALLAVRLGAVRGRVQFLSSDAFSGLQFLEKGDMLLRIGSSTRFGAEFMLAKDSGAVTVLIWDGSAVPEQKYADHAFVAPNDAALAAVLRALVAAVGETSGKSLEKARKDAGELCAEYGKYER